MREDVRLYMKINNVEKAMPAKDGVSLRADIEKIRFDFLNDIANELKELYEKEKKKGQSFNDWLKSKPKEELERLGSKKGGIIKDPTYTYYDDGGSVKPPIKDDIPIKDINLDSELNKLGNIFLKLNNRDRATVMDLLKRSGVIKDD